MTTERFRVKGVRYDRRQRRVAGVTAAVFGGLCTVMLAPVIGPFAIVLALACAVILPLIASALLAPRRFGATEVMVERGKVVLPELLLSVSAASVQSGIDSIAQHSVVLDLTDGRVLHLELADDDEKGRGAWLLEQLGVGPSQTTTRVPLRRWIGRFTLGFVTFFLSLIASLISIPLLAHLLHTPLPIVSSVFAITMLATFSVVFRFGAPHVVIGTDGLRIRGMWSQPFLRFSDIERVERALMGGMPALTIHLRSGQKRTLPVVAIPNERIAGLIERIERSRQRADATPRVAVALTRAGRPVDAWRADLTQLADRQASFRDAAFEREDFERIVADPNADADHRIGAAYVLYRIDPEAGKARIRVAAEATAEDELREALHAAAEGMLEARVIATRR